MNDVESTKNDDYFAIPSLKESEKHDFFRCEKKVKEIIQCFVELQVEYNNILPPRITRNYEVVYTTNNNVRDNVGDFVIKKITTEEEVKKFYNLIYWALTKLNKNEMLYFTEALYYGNSINKISEKHLISTYYVKQIRNSCILKLAKIFKLL